MTAFQQLVPGWAREGLSCRGRIEEAQCSSKMNITESVYKIRWVQFLNCYIPTFIYINAMQDA